jgi:hypothetical protein
MSLIVSDSRGGSMSALRSDAPPALCVPGHPSMPGPFKEEIHDLLRRDPILQQGRHPDVLWDGALSVWSFGARDAHRRPHERAGISRPSR